MKTRLLPLKEVSMQELFNGSTPATYEVPIYQRNFAWGKDEISALVQDIYDAFRKDSESIYYIGTLVSFNKGDNVYEIIDGQQRLTTLTLIHSVFEITMSNKLTYRARKKSTNTLKSLPNTNDIDEPDIGIVDGFNSAKSAIEDKIATTERDAFKKYFLNNVHIIHYNVPRDIDLNRYFEIMNSRGEQLEKHEIVKANLLAELTNPDDRNRFNMVWECCSDMGIYIQRKYPETKIFGYYLEQFDLSSFGEIPAEEKIPESGISIKDLLNSANEEIKKSASDNLQLDSFQPIIDFPNFLLIVLKLTRIKNEPDFSPNLFNLDDKELLNEFKKVNIDEEFVKQFCFNLLKAKYLLDNYIVHHSNEEDRPDNNPWKLQMWLLDSHKKGSLKNLVSDDDIQFKLLHLLSLFEVSFTARQRKNYLFYCLLYLFDLPSYGEKPRFLKWYYSFVEKLADKYFRNVYLMAEKLNEINTPRPGSFDDTILVNNKLDVDNQADTDQTHFESIYGDGTTKTRGIPLFVFNYLDYKLWKRYSELLRGEGKKKGSKERTEFFTRFGCSDFDLEVFDQFYFSRTRRSLEHYYPQANINKIDGVPNENQIDCFGNYAMIGSEANSSGSNWTPMTKRDHYLDSSGKVRQVSIASIKFIIMMQKCKDNQGERSPGLEWTFDDIRDHQERMMKVLFNK
ncbi:MAG: DUF262 domain-containing protein [Clostridia bacterium]|nr:DUF262 domain-containing protein [Clostridia bacterium]